MAASTDTDSATCGNIDELLKSIPACIRCRTAHRKCDATVPMCRNCTKAGVSECLYYDQILAKNISRSYVKSLALRLKSLRAEAEQSSTSTTFTHVRGSSQERRTTDQSLSGQTEHASGRLYMGSHACITGTKAQIMPSPSRIDLGNIIASFSAETTSTLQTWGISDEFHSFLARNYIDSMHSLYPILSQMEVEALRNNSRVYCYGSLSCPDFNLPLIYAISCYSIPHYHPEVQRLLPMARGFFNQALSRASEATPDVSAQTLQNILLLALYSLFEPSACNWAQLISLCGRLCVDLNIRNSDDPHHRRLYLVSLCLERQTCLTLDRPWFLRGTTIRLLQDQQEPIELLWALLSLQSSLHQRSSTERYVEDCPSDAELPYLSSLVNTLNPPSPTLLCVLRAVELELLGLESYVGPRQQILDTAASLLYSYNDPACIHSFLAPHWIMKAAQVLLQNRVDTGTNTETFKHAQIALVLLERDSQRWPSSKYMVESLQAEL